MKFVPGQPTFPPPLPSPQPRCAGGILGGSGAAELPGRVGSEGWVLLGDFLGGHYRGWHWEGWWKARCPRGSECCADLPWVSPGPIPSKTSPKGDFKALGAFLPEGPVSVPTAAVTNLDLDPLSLEEVVLGQQRLHPSPWPSRRSLAGRRGLGTVLLGN